MIGGVLAVAFFLWGLFQVDISWLFWASDERFCLFETLIYLAIFGVPAVIFITVCWILISSVRKLVAK